MSHNTNFLVLGGGQQGQVVAKTLNDKFRTKVTIADFRRDLKAPAPEISVEFFDASDVCGGYRNALGYWFKSFDVVVSCLPSQFGGPCVELAAEYGANFVDLSYTTDNLFLLGPLAQHSGCTIVTDCGLAPGLPNLVAGHYLDKFAGNKGEKLPQLDIYVGGVSKDPNLPLGYVETWSLEDLYEEYVRPGRYVEHGKEVIVSPTDLKALRVVEFEGQKFEAFTSDGLRTLLAFKNVAPNMREWTLRYPGHMEQVQEMIYGVSGGLSPEPLAKERFVEKFRSRLCEQGTAADRVILAVDCGGDRMALSVEGTEEITAMAKTTAYTCATMASFVATFGCADDEEDKELRTGVMSMELIGRDNHHFSWIKNHLSKLDVNLVSEATPK